MKKSKQGNRHEKVAFACENCGKKTERAYAHFRRVNHHFCSHNCWVHFSIKEGAQAKEKHPRWNDDVKERPCGFCGILFRPRPHKVREGKGKFCSTKCGHLSSRKTEEKHCLNCDSLFYPRVVRHGKRTMLCSRKCYREFAARPENNPFYGKKHTDENLRKLRQKVQAKPNALEKEVIEIIEKHQLPYKFVGNGAFIVEGKNPDFVNTNGKKQVVEIFGNYWHSPLENPKIRNGATFDNIKKHYVKYGFECVIIWEDDITEDFVLGLLGGGDKP